MMKQTVALLLCSFLVVGCGAAATPTPMAPVSPPWGVGDRAEYAIEMDGRTIGTLVFTTTTKEDGYVFTTETSAGPVKDVSNVRTDKSLRPIGTTRQVTGAGQADFTLMTVYSKGKLSIQAKTAGGDKAVTIDVPSDSWDNDQLLMSIRALPLAAGFSHALSTVVGQSATVNKTQLTVTGKEQVTVPLGSVTTYKVEMSFGPSKHYAWYDIAAPHHIVKYENTDFKQVIVLTKVGMP